MSDDPRDESQIDDARLSAWLDGELDEDEARELAERVETDLALAARLRDFEQIDEELRALTPDPVPIDARDRLRSRIVSEAPQPAEIRPSQAAPPPLAAPRLPRRVRRQALAALAAAAALFLYLVRPSPEPVLPRPGGLADQAPPGEREALAHRETPSDEGTSAVAELPLERELLAEIDGPVDDGELADLAAEDLPVVEVLDWLEALDELDPVERG